MRFNIIKYSLVVIFLSALLCHRHVQAREDSSLRELINRLNTNYSFLNEEFKKLEKDIKGFSETSLSISIIKRDNSKFVLTSVEVLENDNLLAEHFYSSIENKALDAGGRHQLFSGEFKAGNHTLRAVYYWTEDGNSVMLSEVLLPITISIGKTQLLELSFEKRGDKVVLKDHQFNFTSR